MRLTGACSSLCPLLCQARGAVVCKNMRVGSKSSGVDLTEEQKRIVEWAARGKSFKIAAFAGTGKTTSLIEAARALRGKRILYLVFNRAQAIAAETRFAQLQRHEGSPRIETRTAHSIAWRLHGHRYGERIVGQDSIVMRAWFDYALRTRALRGVSHDERPKLSRAAIETLKRFFASPDPAPDASHVGREHESHAERIANAAQELWSELDGVSESRLPVSHDVYLKAWQLSRPKLPWCDVVMYDEAQDATPAMLDVVSTQRDIQQLYVGDEHQQIYEFRYAVNALQSVHLPALALTETWRFGNRIAAIANAVLAAKGERRRVRPGRAVSDSARLGYGADSELMLARTNAGLIEQALRYAERDASVFIRGQVSAETGDAANGFSEIASKLLAAFDVWQEKKSKHPIFEQFASWEELKNVSTEDGAEHLRPFVRLVEQHQKRVPLVVKRLKETCVATPGEADVILSTVHRFKGEEARSVSLAADFRRFCYREKGSSGDTFDESEANITYVALTRAQSALWFGGSFDVYRESLERAGIPSPVQRTSQTSQSRTNDKPQRQKIDVEVGKRYAHPTFGVVSVTSKEQGYITLLTESGDEKYVAASYSGFRAL